jgi:hypothetical protein
MNIKENKSKLNELVDEIEEQKKLSENPQLQNNRLNQTLNDYSSMKSSFNSSNSNSKSNFKLNQTFQSLQETKVNETKSDKLLAIAHIAELPPIVGTKNGTKTPGLSYKTHNLPKSTNLSTSSSTKPLKRTSDVSDYSSRSYISKSISSSNNDESRVDANAMSFNTTINDQEEEDEDDSFIKNQDLEALCYNNSLTKRFKKE